MLELYFDLLADVRHDGKYHSIRELVQPDEPEVREIARVLVQAPDFIAASQDFIASFTMYKREIGDFWATPSETLQAQTLRREEGILFSCDCDDMAILLCSILRNYIPPEDIFCAVGELNGEGHMFVIGANSNEEDRIIEATAPSSKPVRGKYKISAIFNDKYAFGYPEGIREFNLKPLQKEELVTAGV